LEEDRIGAMYVKNFLGRIGDAWSALFPRGLMRSPAVPALALILLILGPAVAWNLHRRGQFHKAKGKIDSTLNSSGVYSSDEHPGGLDPLMIKRAPTTGGSQPEFTSATLLPGLGMTVLQITANVPGRGDIPLLMAPSLADMGQGSLEPPTGFNDNHGAFEVPWGGELFGAPSPVGTSITVKWQGQSFDVSTDRSPQVSVAEGGALENVAADQQSTGPAPDGMQAHALFHNVSGDEHWPSHSDVAVSAALAGRLLELLVQVKNTGDSAEPMGIGWHPRFQTAGSRNQVQLKLPDGDAVALVDPSVAQPSGKLEPAGAALQKFQAHPSELGAASFDASLAKFSGSPAAEIRFPAAGFGLRMAAASPTIKVFRVTSPAGSDYLSLGVQTNYDDPFGRAWGPDGGGMVTLEPGDSMEWRVRLEIFPLPKP
jgi:galactose mutarotase-like enzyme